MGPPGSGDCETRIETWGQPVLAVSSLAYVLAGVVLLVWGLRRADVDRREVWLFAGGLVATGLGSLDYHGPAVGPEPLLHDGGLALALVVAFGVDLRVLGLPGRRVAWWLTGGTIAMLGFIALVPVVSPAFAGVAAVGLVVAEVMIYRRGLRALRPALWVGIGALAVGAVLFSLSRTGGVLCQPDSWWQGHAAWHVLTAVALGLWGFVSLPHSDVGEQIRAPKVAS